MYRSKSLEFIAKKRPYKLLQSNTMDYRNEIYNYSGIKIHPHNQNVENFWF